MRYGIFSDIHSNLEALKAVVESYQSEKIDQYLCAGDIVGYGADPNECVKKTKDFAEVIVAGNHDWASVGFFPLEYFNDLAAEAILWTKGRLEEEAKSHLETLKLTYQDRNLTLVHSSLDHPQEFNYLEDEDSARETFKILRTNVCFIGHTHVPASFMEDPSGRLYYREGSIFEIKEANKYIINIGSVGQPRDRNPKACYCIYDTERKEVVIKRVDYNKEAARQKMIRAGLPEFLGERILLGS